MFWTDEAEAGTDRTRVAQYLASEAGKFAQKRPPPGFEKVGRLLRGLGTVGRLPSRTTTPLDADVAAEVEARLVRWVRWKLRVLRQGAPPTTPPMTRVAAPKDGEFLLEIQLRSDAPAGRTNAGTCGPEPGGCGRCCWPVPFHIPAPSRARRHPAAGSVNSL